jgi:predicted nucleic acid-binding protein
VTLCDAGPLFALVDARQGEIHRRCTTVLPQLPSPLVTTWPSFTEAMYLAHRSGGWPLQDLLWQFVRAAVLVFHELGPLEMGRMAVLMEQYRDTPMDLADASLVATAESLGRTRIFTLDHRFRVYRIGESGTFEIVP